MTTKTSPRISELWLTPLIGLLLLGPLIYHWRLHLSEMAGPAFADGWRPHFKADIRFDIAIALIPLLVTACLQRLLRAVAGTSWLPILAAAVAGGVITGVFYYYALLPIPYDLKILEEGIGNDMTIFIDDIQCLGFLGGIATAASALVVRWQGRTR